MTRTRIAMLLHVARGLVPVISDTSSHSNDLMGSSHGLPS